MPKLHVELDGTYREGGQGVVLKDGTPQPDVMRLEVVLDPSHDVQVVALERALIAGDRIYRGEETGVLTKLTMTLEYEEL